MEHDREIGEHRCGLDVMGDAGWRPVPVPALVRIARMRRSVMAQKGRPDGVGVRRVRVPSRMSAGPRERHVRKMEGGRWQRI
jgi:hypothetical protein